MNRLTRPSWVTKAQHDWVKAHPSCAACASRVSVQAHHVKPYNKFPSMAADPTNFISLCEGIHYCHLRIGHGGAFQFYNPDVVADADAFLGAGDVQRLAIRAGAQIRRQLDR